MLKKHWTKFQNKHVVHFCDNQTVVHSYKNMGSSIPELNCLIRQIYELLQNLGSTMSINWCSTDLMLADAESRTISYSEEFLPKCGFEYLKELTGLYPTIDCMATFANTKCNRFIEFYSSPDGKAVDRDFLAIRQLKDTCCYVFPPKKLLTKTLLHINENFADKDWIVLFHRWLE